MKQYGIDSARPIILLDLNYTRIVKRLPLFPS